MLLTVTTTGQVRCVYSEAIDLDALGTHTIRRASNVEPGDDGWYAYIVDGPTLGPFAKRSEAIAAEVRWLEEHSI